MENPGEGKVGVSEPVGFFVPAPRAAPATSPPARTTVYRPRRPARVRRALRSRGFIGSVAVFVLAVGVVGVWAVQRVRAVEAAVAEAQSHSAAFQAAVTSGDDAAARSELHALQSATARARALTSGAAWGLAGYAPFVGDSMSAAKDLLGIADEASHRVLPSLQSAVQRLGSRTLNNAGSGIDLAALAGARDDVQRAQAALDPLRARLARVPANGLIGPIGGARAALAADLDDAAQRLRAAGANLSIAVPMLGGDGPRNYLITLQDPAIPAGPGGGIVAYARVNAEAGQFSLLQVGGPQDLPAGMRAVESSPDFPDVARRWLSASGSPADGILTLDTVVLSDLLAQTGPATLPDGTIMYSADRIQLSPAAATRLRTTDGRSAYAAELARAALDKVLSAGAGQAVIDTVRADIDAGRIQLASTRPAEQRVLATGPLGGAVPRTDGPLAYLSVTQDGGAPLGRWLDRSVSYAAGPCSAARRQSTVTARLTNSAPAHPQLDWFAAAAGTATGQDDLTDRLRVGVVLTTGTRVTGGTLNGQPVAPTVTDVAGHPFAAVPVEIPRGTTGTLRLTVDEPAVGGTALVPTQPLVAAQDSQVHVPACGAG